MPSTLVTLHKIAEREFGMDSEQTAYLSFAAPKFEKLRDEGTRTETITAHKIPASQKGKRSGRREQACPEED